MYTLAMWLIGTSHWAFIVRMGHITTYSACKKGLPTRIKISCNQAAISHFV